MKKTAAQLWTDYRDTAVIAKCEKFAFYTLPGQFVDPLVKQQSVQHDFQSVGGLLTNNLSSKLTRGLFPPGIPFFKSALTKELQEAAQRSGKSAQEVENALNRVDQQAAEKLFLNAATAQLTAVIKLLIITGNALLYRDPKTGEITVWNLHSYVVRRTANGKWRCVVLKQTFPLDELPDAIRNDYIAKKPGAADRLHSQIDLYTKIEVQPGALNARAVVTTEIDGIRVGPESSYPQHLCPWVVPTWNLSSGEHYGRGLVEDFTGDFSKLSLMSEQLGLYELESLSILNLVDEAAGGVVDEYQEADTGEFVRGKTAGITSYERGDYNKINAVNNGLMALIQRLSQAFMYTANTRQAERVTAEEIRNTASEADQNLGGVYSLLAEVLQTPLAYLCMQDVSDDILVGLVNKSIRPTILTGVAALTRAIAVQNLLEFTQEAAVIVPALVQLDTRVDKNKLLDLLYNAKNIDTQAIMKDADQLAAEARAAKQAAQQTAQDTNAAILAASPDVQSTVSQLG